MILVTGANGFVGHHLVKGLTAAGHTVRAVVRANSPVDNIKGEGVEIIYGDVGDLESLSRAAAGCDAVIHLVGIIQEGPGFTFRSIHVDGTRNVIEAAKKAGTVRHFIYQSALGTSKDAPGDYYRTKYVAEGLTRDSGLNFTITRPSIIYGEGDGFTAKMRELIEGAAPFVPVAGSGGVLFQPVYIDDLVKAFIGILNAPAFFGKTLEVCGPDRLSLNDVIDAIKNALGSARPLLHIPLAFVWAGAAVMERLSSHPPVTTGQLKMLQIDNVCDCNFLQDIGIQPTGFADGLGRFMRRTAG